MNLYEIQKDEHQKKVSEFLYKYGFFAFNDKQIKEGLRKLNIQPGQKGVITVLPGGGYILSERIDEFLELVHAAQAERAAAIADPETGKQFAYDMFYTELANHEYTYTGDESETLEALGITPEDLDGSETLRAALARAKKDLLRESAELDLIDDLRKIEDEIYLERGIESNPGGTTEDDLIAEMARRIITDGMADKITPEILDLLTAHNYHLVRRAAESIVIQ